MLNPKPEMHAPVAMHLRPIKSNATVHIEPPLRAAPLRQQRAAQTRSVAEVHPLPACPLTLATCACQATVLWCQQHYQLRVSRVPETDTQRLYVRMHPCTVHCTCKAALASPLRRGAAQRQQRDEQLCYFVARTTVLSSLSFVTAAPVSVPQGWL